MICPEYWSTQGFLMNVKISERRIAPATKPPPKTRNWFPLSPDKVTKLPSDSSELPMRSSITKAVSVSQPESDSHEFLEVTLTSISIPEIRFSSTRSSDENSLGALRLRTMDTGSVCSSIAILQVEVNG